MKKNKTILFNTLATISLLFLTSCSLLQQVKKTPAPNNYGEFENTMYLNGYPIQKQPWIVYSDRKDNKINPSTKEDLYNDYKKASFLEPFIVLKRRKGMLKLARYNADLISQRKIKNRKSLTIVGWVPENHLLLWSNSLKNSINGFSTKAAIVVSDSTVINDAKKYIDKESALTFTSPNSVEKSKTLPKIGSLVYIYKESEDKSYLLIGKDPSVKPDSIEQNIYGWIPRKMISTWGEKAALKFTPEALSDSLTSISLRTDNSTPSTMALTHSELQKRIGLESIYPVLESSKEHHNIRFFTNIFDYNKNRVYNVLGDSLFYKQYKKVLIDNRKLNVVFVLDGSNINRAYSSVTRSLFQELKMSFQDLPYFTSVKFGGVVYADNSCELDSPIFNLSDNYKDLTAFFDKKLKKITCSNTMLIQPVDQGLIGAKEILSDVKNQTNIVIIMGTTANDRTQTQTVTNVLTETLARPIFFQTNSQSANAYNNFVLLAREAVKNNAKKLVEAKKSITVDQSDLLIETNYNVTEGTEGVYSLDYPKQSMTQGFVIFPKKGESMQAAILKSAIDSLLVQVTYDNEQSAKSLTNYFKSFGSDRTYFDKIYNPKYADANMLVPEGIASSLLTLKNSFVINGEVNRKSDYKNFEYGLLLNEKEYEEIRYFYTKVYKEVTKKGRTSKNKAIKSYLNVVSKYSPSRKNISKNTLKRMTMEKISQISIGTSEMDYPLMKSTPNTWINGAVKDQRIMDYFKQFGEFATQLGSLKGDPSIRFKYNDQVLYWVSEKYIPKLESDTHE